MAKKDEKKAVEVTFDLAKLTSENIAEALTNSNKGEATIADAAFSELKEDDKKRNIATMKEIIRAAEYNRTNALLQVRKAKELRELSLEKVQKAEELVYRACGKVLYDPRGKEGNEIEILEKKYKKDDVLDAAAVLTPTQYSAEIRKLNDEFRKKQNEIEKKFNELHQELYTRFPDWRNYEWWSDYRWDV